MLTNSKNLTFPTTISMTEISKTFINLKIQINSSSKPPVIHIASIAQSIDTYFPKLLSATTADLLGQRRREKVGKFENPGLYFFFILPINTISKLKDFFHPHQNIFFLSIFSWCQLKSHDESCRYSVFCLIFFFRIKKNLLIFSSEASSAQFFRAYKWNQCQAHKHQKTLPEQLQHSETKTFQRKNLTPPLMHRSFRYQKNSELQTGSPQKKIW